jgi:hypothetical protein
MALHLAEFMAVRSNVFLLTHVLCKARVSGFLVCAKWGYQLGSHDVWGIYNFI